MRVIALGFFDGVHIGHGALLRRTRERATELGLRAAAMSFDSHPDTLVSGVPVPLINSMDDRAALMRRLYGIDDVIFSDYNVKLLIGTLNPEVEGIPYMGIESIMANEEIQVLNQLIADYLDPEDLALFGENIMKNFTLSNMVNHLTILNPEKVMDDAEEIVEELEDSFHVSLESTTKVGLYVHLSCLIERLLLKQGIEDVDGVQEFKKNNSDRFEIVRNAFSVVEMRYSVEISDPEIMYILNYF